MNTQHQANPPVGHSQWAEERNQGQIMDYCCNRCGSCFEELKQLNEHKKTYHMGQTFNGFKTVRGQCHFYLEGRCNKNPCKFSHGQQQQQQPEQQQEQQQQRSPACTRGQNCRFLAWGICNFFHPGVGVQQPKVQIQNQNMHKKKCHFQLNCWNPDCAFEHEDLAIRHFVHLSSASSASSASF